MKAAVCEESTGVRLPNPRDLPRSSSAYSPRALHYSTSIGS